MYEKQTWKNGDVITEEKLNHMEDGIASCGMFVVGSTDDESTQTTTLDKTYKEIADASNAGQNVILKHLIDAATSIEPLVSYGTEKNKFVVRFISYLDQLMTTFSADSENDYPSYYYGDGEGGGGSNF